jgi:SHS2 domain-containing protein
MYRFVDHTAELELEIEAGSAEGVLEEALRAFGELVGEAHGERTEHAVSLEAADEPALLAAWLEELVFLAETEGFVAESADVDVVGTRAEGVLRGRQGEPRPLVKAVTLHRLRLRRRNGVWEGRAVLDV